MIKCSQAFLEYFLKTDRGLGEYSRVELYDRQSGEMVFEFPKETLVAGKTSVQRDSLNSSVFAVGAAVISVASFTYINKTVDVTIDLIGLEARLFVGLKTDYIDEEVQIFTGIIPTAGVEQSKHSTKVSIAGILSLFDQEIESAGSGDAYTLANWCCDKVGVELVQSREEMAALSTNTQWTLFISNESAINTYRDVLIYVSQVIGCFVKETADGKIEFVTYSQESDVFTVNDSTIEKRTYGERGIYTEAIEWSYGGDLKYIGGSSKSTYIMSLIENQLTISLTEEIWKKIADALFDQIKLIPLSAVSLKLNGCPFVEPGDRVVVQKDDFVGFITSVSWASRAGSTIVSSAIDKRLATKSQAVRQAGKSGGGGSGDKNDLSILRVLNLDYLEFYSVWQDAMSTYFATEAGVVPYISLSARVEFEGDGYVELQVLYNSVVQGSPWPYQVAKGMNTLNFAQSFAKNDEARSNHILIQCRVVGEGTVKIKEYDMELNILARNATSADPEWSGKYTIVESLQRLKIGGPIILVEPEDGGPSTQLKEWRY